MINLLSKISHIINKKQLLLLALSFLLVIFTTLLETIGLGSIAGFVYFISDPELILEKIPSNFNFLKINLENKTVSELTIYLAVILVLFFLFKNLVILGYHFFIGHLKKNINVLNTKKLLNKYLQEDYSFFSEKPSEELINDLNSEILRCSHYLFFIIALLKEIFLVLTLFITLLFVSWKLTSLLFLILAFFSIIFYFLLRNKSKKLGEGVTESSKNILKDIVDSIKNFKIIRLLSLKNFFIEKVERNVNKKNTDILYQTIINLLPRHFLEIIAVFIVSVIICYFIFNNYSFDKMISIITFISLIVVRLVPAISNINVAKTSLKHFESSFNNISAQLENYKIKNGINQDIDNNVRFKSLKIENLNFKYKSQKDLLIKNLNFEIKKGDVLGIIGESGVGKSTLVNIILGLLKFKEGEIYLNGKILKNKNSHSNSFFGYVPQETYLMNESIQNNVAFGVNEDLLEQNRLASALQKANIYDYVKNLSNGTKSLCGDNGISMSGGQKQRIGIARALYRDPELLILDEATSALDEKTESEIFDDILGLKGKTIIIVTHKKTIMRRCSKVLELKGSGNFIFGNKDEII